MKTLTWLNQKGGVGKSTLATQFSYFLNLLKGKRVLFIDLDHQANSSKALRLSELTTVYSKKASDILNGDFTDLSEFPEESTFMLVEGDRKLLDFEKRGSEHGDFATNIRKFLTIASSKFDVCLIDTNPNPDIRVKAAMASSTHCIAPVQLNQEAIDGIAGVLKLVSGLKSKVNPDLSFIGILPNLFEATSPFQKDNFKAIVENYFKVLIPVDPAKNQFAIIPRRSVFAEAQAEAKPVFKITKTAGSKTWKEIEPSFSVIMKNMGIE